MDENQKDVQKIQQSVEHHDNEINKIKANVTENSNKIEDNSAKIDLLNKTNAGNTTF